MPIRLPFPPKPLIPHTGHPFLPHSLCHSTLFRSPHLPLTPFAVDPIHCTLSAEAYPPPIFPAAPYPTYWHPFLPHPLFPQSPFVTPICHCSSPLALTLFFIFLPLSSNYTIILIYHPHLRLYSLITHLHHYHHALRPSTTLFPPRISTTIFHHHFTFHPFTFHLSPPSLHLPSFHPSSQSSL